MSKKARWITVAGAGLLAATIATTAALGTARVSLAAAPTTSVAQQYGPGGPGGQGNTYLADALGITVDEVTAAQQKARDAAITQAVDKGLITQAQADALRNGNGFGRGGMGMLLRLGGNDQIDQQALLADALGITTDKLQAAEQEASKAASDARIAQAVKDGRITQEQADLMQARQKLAQWIQDQGYFAKAVEAAVKAGVITQAQADTILAQDNGQGMRGLGMAGFGPGGFEMGGFGGMGGRGGGYGGHGMGGGMHGAAPQAPADSGTQS